MEEAKLQDRLTDMARRGVVFDIECKGRRYVTLPPVVIGFFEVVFMRARPDMPMKELADLFESSFTGNNGAVARALWAGQTQLAPTFVNEQSLPPGDPSEILDWERATHIVATAGAHAVGMCQCRHMANHRGLDCGKPSEVCLSFNWEGLTRAITRDEAMAILARSRAVQDVCQGAAP
ncbi:MAG: hypothetical protein AB1568_14665 [Thermodesulfobacteriota bacterium]